MKRRKKNIKESSKKYKKNDNTNALKKTSGIRYFGRTKNSKNTATMDHGHPMNNHIGSKNTVYLTTL